jgi:HEPN domain-containing protein
MTRIDELRASDYLQDVRPDRRRVRRLLDDARRHLDTARVAQERGDLAGAYQLGYDAARKSLTAMLADRGLRARGEGAHAHLIDAVMEIYADTPGIEVISRLDRLRRTRNQAEYAGYWFDEAEVTRDLLLAEQIVDLAGGALEG